MPGGTIKDQMKKGIISRKNIGATSQLDGNFNNVICTYLPSFWEEVFYWFCKSKWNHPCLP